jgi:hypothetical protein
MELLIPGLALVALMVWASTRLKRYTAAAFEAETIETDYFMLRKPDGLLHVLNDDSGAAFRAYSKEFGTGPSAEIRQATAEVHIHENASVDEIRDRIAESVATITSEQPYTDAGEKATVIEAERGETFADHYKLVQRGSRVFELKISVLRDDAENFSQKVSEMLDGFLIK